MRRVLLLGAILLGLGGTAQAHGSNAGQALLRSMPVAHAPADSVATCPAGVPVQAIAVINQAKVSPWALAKVENAIVAQSLQLRAAWSTPCVQFASGGWPIYLQIESTGYPEDGNLWGAHFYKGEPYGFVWTTGVKWWYWSSTLSHEVIEMLVDPTTAVTCTTEDGGLHLVEVADPVAYRSYLIGGVPVSDFVLPGWYAGAAKQQVSPIASADASGPYDEMHLLGGPWQTRWGVAEPTVTTTVTVTSSVGS